MATPTRAKAPLRTAPAGGASDDVLGAHPPSGHPLGSVLTATDRKTAEAVPHRVLSERPGLRAKSSASLRAALTRHHASAEAIERTKKHREALKRLGLDSEQAKLRRFPTNASTRKGNLAEVVLAEYVVATSGVALPVYRLRYNPNIDQSMKGDDVLAFDLDADPVRIIVGEAKFRATSTNMAVKEIVEGLVRSYKAGIPASLQFVADRLFEAGDAALGERVLACAILFARGKLRLDYVGLLLSDNRAAERVDAATPASLHRLAMISFGVDAPDALVDDCYRDLE